MKTLMNRIILLASLLPGLLFAATTTLNPVADAHVRGAANTLDSNFGTVTPINVRTDANVSNRYDSYFKFELGTASNVTQAKLRLSARLSGSAALGITVSSDLYAVADTAWGETTITWNNKPALGSVLGQISVAGTGNTSYVWYEIDITGYVQSELAAGRTSISLGLHNPSNTSQAIQITAKDAASNKPELVLTTNTPPTVSLSAPANGATYTAPASITLSATASDADGPVSLVEFYNGSILLGAGVETAGVWSYTWSNVAAGSYPLSAKAYDSNNVSTTSSTATVTVNAAPTTTTTTLNPTADAHVRAAATTLNTNYGTATPLRVRNDATPSNQYDAYLKFDLATLTGAVTKATLRLNGALNASGTVATSVYGVSDTIWTETGITWSNKPALGASLGSASVSTTAYAWYEIDVTSYVQSEYAANRKLVSLGLHNLATSTQITQIVSREGTNKPELVLTTSAAVPPGVYYVYADHLNTPRLITDQTNKTVWRWDSDPFGTDVASEDPDGDGVKFNYNLRFPGQYFDAETGLHQNYFRDYEPGTGRYVQSDPLGLFGGSLSTFGYANQNPISFIDPMGLSPAIAGAGGSSGLGVGGAVGNGTGSSNSKTPSYGTIPGVNNPRSSTPFWPSWMRNIYAMCTEDAAGYEKCVLRCSATAAVENERCAIKYRKDPEGNKNCTAGVLAALELCVINCAATHGF